MENLKHKGKVVPSPETFKSGGAFARTSQLYRELELLSKKVNEAMQLVDPVFYEALRQLDEVARGKHASWRSVDGLLFEGCELLFN